MSTATLPTLTKQQQHLQSRVNYNSNDASNSNGVTAITGGISTSTSTSNGRKRSMDTGTQTEDGSPPTKARIVGSPLPMQTLDIVHDGQACMFKMKIDGRGSIGMLDEKRYAAVLKKNRSQTKATLSSFFSCIVLPTYKSTDPD